MKKFSTFLIVTLSALNLAASGTTAYIAYKTSKQMQAEVAEVKTKTNKSLSKIKTALDDLEI